MSIARFYSRNSEQVFFGRIDTPQIRYNGQARITFTEDGKIDFNNVPIRGLVIQSIGEEFTHLIIENSIQIGSGATGTKPDISLTGAGMDNLVLNSPSGRQTNFSINGVAQAYVNGSGITITTGSLFISTQGANLSQSSGNLWYRVNAGSSHIFYINAVPIMTLNSIGLTLPQLNAQTTIIQNTSTASLVTLASGMTNRDSRLTIRANGNSSAYNDLFLNSGDGVAGHRITWGNNLSVDDTSSLTFAHAKNSADLNNAIMTLGPDSVNITSDLKITYGKFLLMYTSGGNHFAIEASNNDIVHMLTGSTANYRIQLGGDDKVVISNNLMYTRNIPLTVKAFHASSLTLDADADNGYIDVPAAKAIRMRNGGFVKLEVTNNTVNSYVPVVIEDTTDSVNIGTGSLRVGGGVGISKRFYCNGNVGNEAQVAIGPIYGSTDITMQMRASNISNSRTVLHMRSNYNGNQLNGFHIVSEYGDTSAGDNRYHGSLYIKQSRVMSAPSTFNSPENRLVFGSQRDIRFSTNGSDSNDFMIIAGGIKLKAGLLADFDQCDIKGVVIGPSDQRLKHDITNIDGRDALSVLNKVKVKTFRFNDFYRRKNGAVDKLEFGVIAQEIQEIPELRDTVKVLEKKAVFDSTECKEETYKCDISGEIKTRRIPIPEAEIDDLLGVEHSSRLTYLAVSAIQELTKQNAYLLEKVRIQKERLDLLENKCSKLEESVLLYDDLQAKVKSIFSKLNMLEENVQSSTGINTFDSQSFQETRSVRSVLGI